MSSTNHVFAAVGVAIVACGSVAFMPLGKAPVGKTIVVKMIDKSPTEFTYEPAQVTANPGDVVQFVQVSATPHNVDFRETPAGADLGAAKTGEYMLTPNQKYELRIDARFKAGNYKFVCTPHEALGMKGSLTIVSGK